MLTQFRIRYPQGSLISELITIDHGKYVVQVSVEVEGVTLATGLAGADTVEQAEDHARTRALNLLDLAPTKVPEVQVSTPVASDLPTPIASVKMATHTYSESDLVETNHQTNFSLTTEEVIPTQSEPSYLETASNQLSDLPVATAEFSETDAIPETTETETQGSLFDNEKIVPQIKETFPETEISLETESTEPLSKISDSISEEPVKEKTVTSSTSAPQDFSEIIAKSTVEIKRLGWTNEQGRDYLLQTYGKRSRQLLTDEELLEFLEYLENQPTP
ncbi:MAG: hypothetical protein F6K10_34235 [Moorea sp. SIO2B7]|nr:hypothetical protein [Moorena sp. SIO2B7]